MSNFVHSISVNGWVNLDDAFIAEVTGYQPGIARTLMILNNNAAIAYLHFTDSGTQPATANEGWPISNAGASAPSMVFSTTNVDLSTTWLNTPSAIAIVFLVKD